MPLECSYNTGTSNIMGTWSSFMVRTCSKPTDYAESLHNSTYGHHFLLLSLSSAMPTAIHQKRTTNESQVPSSPTAICQKGKRTMNGSQVPSSSTQQHKFLFYPGFISKDGNQVSTSPEKESKQRNLIEREKYSPRWQDL